MSVYYDQLIKWIVPIAFIVGGFLLGWIFEKIILNKFKKLCAKTKWEGDDIIINAGKGLILLTFIIAGIYGAVLNVSVSVSVFSLLQKGLLAVIILLATVASVRMAEGFVKVYTKKVEGVLPSTSIFINITRVTIFVIGILIILQAFGISITPILTALGVGGLAVALALQDTLSNLFSGLQIIISRQLKPGDYIKLDSGEEGYVEDITWRNTTIRPFANNMIVVPNSKLASTIITNYNSPEKKLSVYIPVGVSYDSDLEKVERITREVAKEVMTEVEGGIPEAEPGISYKEFGDSSINFTVILKATELGKQYFVRHQFIKRLHERYNKEGIDIPFPIRTVYMKQEE